MKYEVKESSGNLMMEKSFSFALRGRAYKEARETSYWLRLLFASKYLTERQFNSLHADCEEMIRILGSTQLTMRAKIQKGL